jgi:hypothetical protein
MAVEGSGGGEFPQLVSDHFLGHEDWDKLFPVMDGKGQPNHFRNNRGSPRPGFDHSRFLCPSGLLHLFHQMGIDKRPLFD